MSRFSESLNRLKGRVNKYYLTVAIFFVLTFCVGDSTLFKRMAYDRKISELSTEIEKYEKERDENETKLKALNSDDESLERFAREQFLMTKPDEELFIIIP